MRTKVVEIARHTGCWSVYHNDHLFRACGRKGEAIRVALVLGRTQLRMGDKAEVVLRDEAGQPQARKIYAPEG